MGSRDQPVVFTTEQLARIDTCLRNLLDNSRGSSVLLADVTGRLVHIQTRLGVDRDFTAVSALATGSFAATAEMAKFLGWNTGLEQALYEGQGYSMHFSTVGHGFLLIIAFDANTKLGLVRVFAREAARQLRQIVEEASQNIQEETHLLSDNFGELLAAELDRSLKE